MVFCLTAWDFGFGLGVRSASEIGKILLQLSIENGLDRDARSNPHTCMHACGHGAD